MPVEQADHDALARLADFGPTQLDALAALDDLGDGEYAEFLAWIDAERALCALTQLNPEQLAGLDALAGMDADEVEAFGRRVQEAWDANQQAAAAAIDAVASALRTQAEVETACGEAARRRFFAAGGVGMCVLNDHEKAQVEGARATVADARVALDEARARCKAGVTAEQLEVA